MPIYIDQPDALAKMAEVEGEEWAEGQQYDYGPCSFNAFKSVFLLIKESGFTERHTPEELNEHSLSVDGNGAIYGDGGWNRYTVRGDGEIMFIQMQAWGKEAVEKAKTAGFRMF